MVRLIFTMIFIHINLIVCVSQIKTPLGVASFRYVELKASVNACNKTKSCKQRNETGYESKRNCWM